MSHSYVSNLMHCTFSTKNRLPMFDSEFENRLWPYIGGIAGQNRMKALAIGARPIMCTHCCRFRE